MSLRIGAMFPEVFRHLFKRPATVLYPFEKNTVPKGLRGRPVMDPDKCIGCKMCERDCPAEAIEIRQESETKTDDGKVKKRFSMTLYVDRCAHCAQCEEICPAKPDKAVKLNQFFEEAAFNRGALKIVYK